MSILLLLAVLVLVLLNGFFVAAEFAYVRARRAHLEWSRGYIGVHARKLPQRVARSNRCSMNALTARSLRSRSSADHSAAAAARKSP